MKKVLIGIYLGLIIFIFASPPGQATKCIKPENKLLFTEKEVFLIKHTMGSTYREVYFHGHTFVGDLLVEYSKDFLDECEHKAFKYKLGLGYDE